MPNLLKVRLSLKGRPIRSYTFNKKSVSIGRDPASDIFLDNTGVSRNHARIERTPGGYVLEDLGSANGTFLNEGQVRREFLGHDDVVQIGKFSLWMGVETDRREQDLLAAGEANPGAFEGTTVLSPDQLQAMQTKSKDEPATVAGPAPERAPFVEPEPAPGMISKATAMTAMVAAFLIGISLGVAVTILLLG